MLGVVERPCKCVPAKAPNASPRRGSPILGQQYCPKWRPIANLSFGPCPLLRLNGHSLPFIARPNRRPTGIAPRSVGGSHHGVACLRDDDASSRSNRGRSSSVTGKEKAGWCRPSAPHICFLAAFFFFFFIAMVILHSLIGAATHARRGNSTIRGRIGCRVEATNVLNGHSVWWRKSVTNARANRA